VLTLAVVGGLAAIRTAEALDDGKSVLVGKPGTFNGPTAGTAFTAPGTSALCTSLGEAECQVRLPAGTLGRLRVFLVTGTATAGSLTVTLRLNGAPTVLTCTVAYNEPDGFCDDFVNVITLVGGDLVSLGFSSTINQGLWSFTYSLVYD